MAVKSAVSCVFSLLRPSVAQPPAAAESSNPASPNPASPWTPGCKEGRVDSSTAAVQQQQHQQPYAAFAASPSVSPFKIPVVKEKSLRVIDPASFLIQRLDKGWFECNVLGIEWWDVCFLSPCRRQGPGTGDLMAWIPRNLADSELLLGQMAGIRTPDLGSSKSPSQNLFPAIEMVQPLVTTGSSSADRDGIGLPRSRLRRLHRGVHPNDEISFSDGEQRRYRRSSRGQAEDLPDALRRFNHKQFESTKAKPSLRRRKEKQVAEVVVPSRRFSDGEEPGVGGSAALVKAKTEAVSKSEVNSPRSSSRSGFGSSSKMRNSKKVERPGGKLEGGPSEKERRRAPHLDSSSMPAPPIRHRRRLRRHNSRTLTDDEYDELRGCIDLGFNFTQDDLTPRVLSVFPGLKYRKDRDELLHSPKKSSPRSTVNSPKGWTRHPDSPLPKFQIPPPHESNEDMKARLKFWAHSVSSTVSAEC